jgi:PAS domain S-box-containing protein
MTNGPATGESLKEGQLLAVALQISNAMIKESSADTVLDMIAEAAPQLAEADACAVTLIDPETGKISYGPDVPLGDVSIRWKRHLHQWDLARQVAETGQQYVVNDTTSCADQLDDNLCKSGVKSFACLPIPGEPHNLGTLFVYSLHTDTFASRNLQVIALLAQQAGIALENLRHLTAARHATEQLTALNQVVLDMGKTVDRPALLGQAINKAMDLADAEGGAVYLLDAAGQHLTLTVGAGLSHGLEGEQIGREDGLSGEILRTGNPQRVAEYRNWPQRLEILDQFNLTGVAGAPIRDGDRILGTLIVHDTDPGREFDDRTLSLLQQFADHAGLALQKTTLLEKLQAIQRVSAATTSSSRGFDDVLDLTCQAAVELLGADHSGLVLFDEDGEYGTVMGEYPPDLNTRGERIPVQGIPAEEKVALHSEIVHIPAVDEYKAGLGPVIEILRRFDIRSILILPIVYRGRVLGSFSLDAIGEARTFTQEEIEFCRVFADNVAVVLENARLLLDLGKAKEQLDRLIASSLDGVISIDRQKKIQVFSRQAEDMLGWTEKEMIGQSVRRLHPDPKIAQDIYDEVDLEGAVYGRDVTLQHKDGTLIPTALSANLIIDAAGMPIGQAGFVRDRRELRLLEDKLRALVRVSQSVTGTLRLDEVLRRIVDALVQAFPKADSGTIHLYNPQSRTLVVRACTQDYSEGALKALELEVGEGIAGWVFQNSEGVEVGDVKQDDRYKPIDHPDVEDHVAMVCVPLQVRGQTIGALTMTNSRAIGAFERPDLELLDTFAAQAAIAIFNARRMRQLEQMHQAVQAMARAADPVQVMREVANNAASVLRADSSIVWSYDQARKRFIAGEVATTGIGRDESIRLTQEAEPGRTAHAIVDSGYLAVSDVPAAEPEVLESATRQLLSHLGAQSFQGVALRVGDETLGVVYLNFSSPQEFGDYERRTLETFASHAALALKRARLLRDLDFARGAAARIARATVVEDLSETLRSIVREASSVLEADAVLLYPYSPEAQQFGQPTMLGVKNKEPIGAPHKGNNPPYAVLERKEPYVAEESQTDPLLSGRFATEEGIKSCVAVPLRSRGTPVGVMFINYRSAHRLTDQALSNAVLFANQAAVAIRSGQLFERATVRANAIEALHEASLALSGSLELEETLDRIVEQAWRLATPTGEKNHFSHLALVEGESLRFVCAYPTEVIDSLLDSIDMGAGDRIGIAGRAVQSLQSQLVGDVRTDPDYIETDSSVRSQLGVPVRIGERVIGVINVEHPGLDAFDEEDQQALEALAAQAAIAIDNARLFESEQQRVRHLELVSSVAQEVSSSLDLEKVLNALVDGLARSLEVEQCAIAVFDEKGEYGDVEAECLEEGCVPATGVKIPLIGNPTIERVQETRRPLVIADAQTDPLMESVWDIMKERRTKSIMIVPIVIDDQVIGTIGLDAVGSRREFTEEEQWLAGTIAHHASIAIQNARAFEELQEAKGLLASMGALAFMGTVATTWRHAVSTNTTTVKDLVELIRTDLSKGRPPSKVEERLLEIEEVISEIARVPMPPVPASIEKSPVLINELVTERVSQLQERKGHYKAAIFEIELSVDRDLVVISNAEWLCGVIDILVDNAVYAVKDSPDKRIKVSVKELEDGAELCVADTGTGIPAKIRTQLFRTPIEKAEGARGSGLGLFLAQRILSAYGASIRVEDGDSVGTKMIIWLPTESKKVMI